jgi:hypothetical protein
VGAFLDRHAVTDISSAVRQQLHLEAVHNKRDRNGALPLGHWVEDGTIYCVLDAPDAHAVCLHHHDRGLNCDDLHALPEISGTRPLTGTDEAIVRAEIARIWHRRADGTA